MDPEQRVPGLLYIPNFITQPQQQSLISNIKQSPWNLSLKRRTQHYGYEYNYNRSSKLQKAPPLPPWCNTPKQSIQQFLTAPPPQLTLTSPNIQFDQLIINEYQPGQGINPHIDHVKLFDDCVVSLSLGSDVVMVFQRDGGKGEQGEQARKEEFLLERRSIVFLTGDARYKWKHGIPGRKADFGKQRGVRYSLTFRKVINQDLSQTGKGQ